MIPSIRSRAVVALALVCVAGAASAQNVQQVLKDVWVATDQSLFDVDLARQPAVLAAVPGTYTVSATRTLAFEPVNVGSGGLTRSLIVVDGAKLMRFENDQTTPLYNAGDPVLGSAVEPELTAVNAVAVADDGTVLFSGYSRPKRVYELWALDPGSSAVKLRATGTPQLTDAVFVSAEDVAASTLPGAGRSGVLAVAAKNVTFFAEPTAGWMSTAPAVVSPPPLFDASTVGLKGNAQLLSVDLVRATNTLILVTSERKLLTSTTSGGGVATVATITKPSTCSIKTPRLLVRNVRGGADATSVVTDSCGLFVRYDAGTPIVATTTSSLVAIAVGEGNAVTCLASEPQCPLTDGFNAKIQTTVDRELLVLQYDNLCDPRVQGCGATDAGVSTGNVLTLNSLLPQAIREALDVDITIPSYMFGAGPNGRFGMLIVQSDDAPGTAAKVAVELYIDQLLGFELGTRSAQKGDPFVRGAVGDGAPTTLNLLNQDIAAYAPDILTLPTVRGFEATPVTTGSYNPLTGGLRGFSVVLYGLQHDLNNAPYDRPRNPQGPTPQTSGGLPAPLAGGHTQMCALDAGTPEFNPVDLPERFFINLAACLFADQEELLAHVIPGDLVSEPNALSDGDRSSLLARLANVKDKLIKALNATGPNTGSTDFQSVLSQVALYDTAVAATPFFPTYNVYKNELAVRSAAFKFFLMERAYPSLPVGGFPPP